MWTSGSRVSNLLYIYNKYNIYTYFSALLNPTAACCSNTSQYQETPPAESIFFWQTAASRLLGFWTFRYRNGYGSTFNSTERTMCLITHLSVWFILASYSFFGRYPNSNYIFKCGLVGKCFQHLMVKTVLFFRVWRGASIQADVRRCWDEFCAHRMKEGAHNWLCRLIIWIGAKMEDTWRYIKNQLVGCTS